MRLTWHVASVWVNTQRWPLPVPSGASSPPPDHTSHVSVWAEALPSSLTRLYIVWLRPEAATAHSTESTNVLNQQYSN